MKSLCIVLVTILGFAAQAEIYVNSAAPSDLTKNDCIWGVIRRAGAWSAQNHTDVSMTVKNVTNTNGENVPATGTVQVIFSKTDKVAGANFSSAVGKRGVIFFDLSGKVLGMSVMDGDPNQAGECLPSLDPQF